MNYTMYKIPKYFCVPLKVPSMLVFIYKAKENLVLKNITDKTDYASDWEIIC